MRSHVPALPAAVTHSRWMILAAASVLTAAGLWLSASLGGMPGGSALAGDAPSGGAAAGAPVGADAKVKIGTFDSRAIAVAYAHSRYNTRVKELMADYQKAKDAGDAARIKELEKAGEKHQDRLHRQGFGRAPVDDLLAHVKARIPEVCKEAGVVVLADDIIHHDPSVVLVDVTDPLVRLFDPDEKTLRTVAELRKVPPLDLDDFPIED